MQYASALRLSFLLIAVSVTQTLLAQVDTGAISGTVRDSTGAVVQAAKVRIVETETGITLSLVTNADGFYSAPALHIGKYNISALAAGFATQTKTDVGLRVQDRLDVDFSLAPGQMSTIVTVESQVPPLQTEDSSIGQVVDDETMQNLP